MEASDISMKRTRSIPDKGAHSIEKRNDQFHMLLSTSYGLNISHTKRIHVGLQMTSDGVFVPMVKLTGCNADGVYFDEDSWRQFQENMDLILEYLSGEGKLKPNPITINNITINFTTAYGARSILAAYKENEENTDTANGNIQKDETSGDPPAKKRRTYTVAIVMQKTTFLGLKNIVKCVDAHLAHLQSLANSVNDCARYLIKEIELVLPKNYIDENIVRSTLKGNYNDIVRSVRTQITDLTFLDMYFDIIFLELTSLRYNEIQRIIFSNRGM